MDKPLLSNSQMFSPMFSSVANNKKVTLDDIKISGYTRYEDGGEGTGGQVVIQYRTAAGATAKYEAGEKFPEGTLKQYFYFDNENTSEDGEDTGAGWYINNKVSAETKVNGADVSFDVGEGVWLSAVQGLEITVAGQVVQSDVKTDLINGSLCIANPYPVTINLEDFYVTGYTRYEDGGEGTGGQVVIQFLTPSGATDKYGEDDIFPEGTLKQYFFFDNENTSEDGEDTGAGWYINNKVSAETKITGDMVTFPAGVGAWVGGVQGLSLHVKAPNAVK